MRKSALVTGASRGIGRAAAAALAREGWPVCINYLERRDAAESLVRDLRSQGLAAMAVQADVADRKAVEAMVRAASETLGPVELLVNNAGISHQGLFQDMDDLLWNRLLAVNLTGPRNAVQAVLPHMLEEKRGCIVNISSIWGLRGGSCETAYACTKAGIIGLTRSLALELAPSGIRVNCVAPGCVETDMVRVLGEETRTMLVEETPLGRLGRPEDIAQAVAFLASERAGFITGQVLAADGGFIVGGPVPSLVVPRPRVDLAGPVDLLQQHHPGQMMGEGHGGHGELRPRLRLDGLVEAEGAPDQKHQPLLQTLLRPCGPGRHGLGQLLAGAQPPLYAQGDKTGGGRQLSLDGRRLLPQGGVDLRLGGMLRQTFFRQLHDLQLAVPAQALGVLRRRLGVELLLQLSDTQQGYPLHTAPPSST